MKFSNVICMFLVGLLISIVSCCKRSVDDVMNDSIPEAKRLRSCDDVDENVDANYPILVDALRNEIDFERDLLYGGFERSMVSSIAYFVSTYPDGVDEEGNNVLNFALLNGMSQSIMSLIIRYGRYSAILPNKAGYTPLFNLLQWTTEIYLFELNRKFSKNHIFSPLLFANRDHLNERDPNGHTLLQIAIESNLLDVAKLLLRYGADPEIPDPFTHITVLQSASRDKIGIIRGAMLDREWIAVKMILFLTAIRDPNSDFFLPMELVFLIASSGLKLKKTVPLNHTLPASQSEQIYLKD